MVVGEYWVCQSHQRGLIPMGYDGYERFWGERSNFCQYKINMKS